jgi:hypothetical protein
LETAEASLADSLSLKIDWTDEIADCPRSPILRSPEAAGTRRFAGKST